MADFGSLESLGRSERGGGDVKGGRREGGLHTFNKSVGPEHL